MIEDETDLLKLKTNRTTFSGSAARLADKAVLYLVIDRLASSDRGLIDGAIEEITENGAKIKFSNGKSLETYRKDAESLIRDLKLPNTAYPSEATFTNTSIAMGYTPSDVTFYGPNHEDV
ncbi:hypothetical protein MSSAC_1023 [Methanosarcina siciliae C2J]|uniref:Uncharacterized protein n=1 Tax=Methanosarcina siciliae C2J TaxID=1434118 RepID=A0A0E3PLE7_9EURY|nr:hypothetical protein [Methanosarcina siciliae]AKB35613.1 hypothetical protein MSSAC_1023 [Methanosarcina siciliae C2J]